MVGNDVTPSKCCLLVAECVPIAKEKRECRIVAIRKQRVSTKISLDIY
jgi:hypothetical protein